MKNIVQIRVGDLNPATKFDTDLDLNINDLVIVESPNGAEWGVVASSPSVPKGKRDQHNVVLRVANADDQTTIERLRNMAQRAIKECNEKIEKHGLEMKVLSAYYTLDAGKVIISFSANNRVDFRELVRDLAFALKTRIELRQVGARDEVKTTGALGPCGQICCCIRFKDDFDNITIKMAKNQNLSLNPQKINGMCGRLLCCLAYENQHYTEVNERMPKYGSEVNTPDGKGIAQDGHALKETINVKMQKGDQTRVECYKLCDVNCKGCRSGK
ncbi:MAG: stage 0 sporulation protein [Firmicutes bacterium]|nr:stage 0 sporulation protein [Bacillota bacterium]